MTGHCVDEVHWGAFRSFLDGRDSSVVSISIIYPSGPTIVFFMYVYMYILYIVEKGDISISLQDKFPCQQGLTPLL